MSSSPYERMKKLNAYYTLRVPHEDMARLRQIAKKSRLSLNEQVLTFITWGLEETEKMRGSEKEAR